MHLFKACRSSVGPSDAISGSITVGPEAMPSARASMRLNSLHSHLTSYWSPAAACWGRSSGATRTIPIVFVQVADAVGGGFVKSLAKPGGNATGFTNFEFDISTKWLE